MRMEMKDGTEALVNNNGHCEEEQVSSLKLSHLLASKDRDFLLAPSGAQVLFLFGFHSLSSLFFPFSCFVRVNLTSMGNNYSS